MYWATVDGCDPREIPLNRRFEQPLSTAPRTWRGNGVLRVMPAGLPYQVIHFWDHADSFAGWYVNFEAPQSAAESRGTRIVIIRCCDRCQGVPMRTTVALDDDLVDEAQRLTGTREKSALLRQALRALIERESAQRLAQLGGSEPDLREVPRRRTASA